MNIQCCPYCQAIISDAEKRCPICSEDLNLAFLVCSHPVVDIQVGTKWNLYPRNYSIGGGLSDDIRIASSDVSEGAMKLIYKDGYFKVEAASREDIRKKEHCCSLRIGGGTFTLHYSSEMKISEYRQAVFPISNIAFSASRQIMSMRKLPEIYGKVLESVLRISGLEKAYYFSVSADREVAMEAMRAYNNIEMDERFCDFSESVIHKALSEEGDIICLDLHNGCGATMSNSMARMRLNKVLCVPLRNVDGLRVGAVYADSQRSSFISPKLCYFKPLLRIFADIAAMRISQLQELDRVKILKS